MAGGWKRGKLGAAILLFEIIFLILFGVFVRYDDLGMPQTSDNTKNKTGSDVEEEENHHGGGEESASAHVNKFYASKLMQRAESFCSFLNKRQLVPHINLLLTHPA